MNVLLNVYFYFVSIRFTKLAAVVKTTSAPPKPAANRARNAASSRNAAAQLAMRPSVQAALKIKNVTLKIYIFISKR